MSLVSSPLAAHYMVLVLMVFGDEAKGDRIKRQTSSLFFKETLVCGAG